VRIVRSCGFTDSLASAKMAHVTSSVDETQARMTSSAAPDSAESLVMTSATPESPISAQLIQSTIAPFIRMNRFEFRFIALAASNKKRNVTVWRPSVCLSVRLSVLSF